MENRGHDKGFYCFLMPSEAQHDFCMTPKSSDSFEKHFRIENLGNCKNCYKKHLFDCSTVSNTLLMHFKVQLYKVLIF